MTLLYEKFFSGVYWNIIENCIYQGLLLCHTIALFYTLPPELNGTISTLFATVYLMISAALCGFDTTIAAFFTEMTTTKKQFLHFLRINYLPTIGMYGLLLGVCALLFVPDYRRMFLLWALILIESNKKIVRTLLQLSFYNRPLALVELGTIITYVTIIWSGYALGYSLSPFFLLIPFALTSLCSLIILTFFVYTHLYSTLPNTAAIHRYTYKQLLTTRVSACINDLGHGAFSANVLVALSAHYFNVVVAGQLKLITSIVHTLTTVLYKIIGGSAQALLSQTKYQEKEIQQNAFTTVTTLLYRIMMVILIFLGINYYSLLQLHHESSLLMLLMLFLGITLSQYIIIGYEKLFIAHGNVLSIALLNCLSGLAAYSVIISLHTHGPFIIMGILLGIRTLLFIFMRWYTHHTLAIHSQWRVPTHTVIQTTLISCLFFALYQAAHFVISI